MVYKYTYIPIPLFISLPLQGVLYALYLINTEGPQKVFFEVFVLLRKNKKDFRILIIFKLGMFSIILISVLGSNATHIYGGGKGPPPSLAR